MHGRLVDAWAGAASGHAAAAPPSSVMNWRRVIRSLVGESEKLIGNAEAECPGSCNIDNQLKLGGLHDRQIGGLRAFENPGGILRDSTIEFDNVDPVAHQAAAGCILANFVDCGHPMTGCECH